MSTLSLQEFRRLILAGTLPPTVVAYHCGSKLTGGKFSVDYIGSGEGLLALGPGIYFATDKDTAMLYCKYVRDPWFYTVEVRTSGLYRVGSLSMDPSLAPVWKKLKAAEQDWIAKGHKTLYFDPSSLSEGSRLKDGPGYVGKFVKALGQKKGRDLLLSLGITGAVEKLSSDYEIAVYEPSIVRVLQAEPL